MATTVSFVVELGRPEVAAACCFAAMVGGNMDAVRDITCKMIDQVLYPVTESHNYSHNYSQSHSHSHIHNHSHRYSWDPICVAATWVLSKM